MNILITGAAGFLGRAFSTFHVERGDHVLGIDDMSGFYSRWLTPDYDMSTLIGDAGLFFDGWDPGNENDFDVVYHFAAPVGGREKIEGDPLWNAGSLKLDAALFRWAARFGTRSTIVYPSSSAVYGVVLQERDKAVALSESMFMPQTNAWAAPDEMYGFTKLAGEFTAWKAASYDVNTLCIRPFSGYGEDQSLEYPVPSICRRVARKENPLTVWGSGQQARDFVHVDDVVGATWARIESGIKGYVTMNIGSGTPMTFNRLATIAAGISGYRPSIENLEDKPQGVYARYCDPSEMMKYYQPRVSLEDGLRRVIAVYERGRVE